MTASASLADLYAQHFAELQRRAAQALARGGFDHLVVPSGTLHYQVFDDRDYPYAVNPQFKAWVPLVRNPGSWLVFTPGATPKLVYLQPFDYWHVVPQAPSGEWVEHWGWGEPMFYRAACFVTLEVADGIVEEFLTTGGESPLVSWARVQAIGSRLSPDQWRERQRREQRRP